MSCERCGNPRASWSERLGEVVCGRCLGDEIPDSDLDASGSGDRTERLPRDVEDVRLTSYGRIEPEQVEWLWAERVPLGMLTLLVGDPGLGKSLLTCHLAAEVSRSGGDVVLSSAEDHAAATVRPRLEAAEADLARVHRADVLTGEGFPRTLELPGDVDVLAARVEKVRARLLVIDPLTAHLPESVNSWRDQSIRRALAPLHLLAQEHACAVIVVAHLNKATGADPLYRTGGSIAIPAAVRSALLLARDPEDPKGDRGDRRVLAHHKCNVAPLADSLCFEVEPAGETARLRATGLSEAQARDLLDAPASERHTERDEAADFLRAELADGPQPVKAIKREAADAGIAWRTVERAKQALGVEAKRVSSGNEGRGRWEWELPSARQPLTTPSPPYPSPGGLAEDSVTEPNSGTPVSHDRHASDMAALPACRYPHHRATYYTAEGGKTICGTCHPRAAGS